MRVWRPLALGIAGVLLIAVAMVSGYVIAVAEQAPPLLVAALLGGLLVGGGSLALATFRLAHRGGAGAWPSVEQSGGLAVAGTLLTLGGGASCHVMGDSPAGFVPLADFFVGVAFTLGALMLLAWAANGPPSTR